MLLDMLMYPNSQVEVALSRNMNVEIQFLILGLIFWVQANIIFILVSIFSSKLKFMDSKNEITSKKYLLEILIYLFVAFWILIP